MGFGGFWLEEEKGQSCKESEHQNGEEGVKVSAIEAEISGRAEVDAEEVYVGNHAGEDDGNRRSAGDAGEAGALKRVRSEGVGEGIHRGEVISQNRTAMMRKRK